MAKLQSLSVFVNERLTVAAVEIFDVVEKVVAKYQEEISRSKEENDQLRRLLRITTEIKEEETPEQQHCEQEWSPSLSQEKPALTQIKEEQEEIWTSQEVGQLQGLETDTIEFIFTPPCVKSECDLPQTVEDRGSDFKLLDHDPFGTVAHIKGLDSSCNPLDNEGNTSSHSSAISSDPLGLDSSPPLRKHTKSSTTSKKPHCCLDCGKCFTQVGRLKMHSRIHSEAKPFSCGDCGNRFQLKGELTKHIVIHTGEKPFNCGDCGKSFNRKLTLNRHILLVHKEGTQCENGKTKGEKPFCCGDCGKSFTRRQTLNRHKMIHTGEKPFHCGYCGKGFNRKETLIDHIQNHTGEKPFSCGDCGKSFNRKRNLTSHLLTHTEEKPFTCGDCGKSFKQKSDLTKHIMIHMEEKPFKCGECGKSFNYKVNLNRHMLFIHKERKQEDSGKKKDN
ncbi:gastrula zinc finger protein XlCGF57.1-like [Oncorhynchus clarkii lewisi]|uniref:gastrula zinc finger protein XlCGF57.1-like n=1 Tax=Oncorhynchus clarkii lewisi TaxID=490388 RepID=UPI0039B92BA8